MIFSPKIQDVTDCSRENQEITRDQMMLGGYNYGLPRFLRDSVFLPSDRAVNL